MDINKVYLKGQENTGGWNDPNKIIIHHPEFYGSIEQLNGVMRNMGFSMIGYNYYVCKDGSVWQGRPVSVTGANCYGQNHCSIGVCFQGNYDKDKNMPQAQFDAGVELIKYLKETYKISEVNGHKYYRNTDCPGRYFPLQQMLKAISNVQNSGGSVEGRYGIVTASVLNVRETNSIEAKVIKKLKKGTKVKIYKQYNDWYSIYPTGCVYGKYIRLL
ncbi:peptidoglycan recognition protein family protein [Clostridium brassicae]|uniref:Peptidoglycan recognition family protein n=1 Tax=Clostridium brassicae TaxID=2999072 RepID=A0ABT4D6R3_9CLOT|nr:peptidoglycan recognition family protein [Clostridium brassicae]MCY6957973.1 peptidoglycan recognition family protein [Clostridium brassicae]